ncbi:hypothetical protein F5884DRAFT_379944 [Xylogone sp. PMI_703]|nr:hypothetical protein F5884DRAFT_379944 [Xylogone sp. PMI_703]
MAGFRAYKCHVCRKRKVKCGGESPRCRQCLRAGLMCTGYQRALDFRIVSNNGVATVPQKGSPASAMISDLESTKGSEFPLSYQRAYAVLESSYICISPSSQYQEAFLKILQAFYLPESFALADNRNKDGSLVPAVCATWLYSACNLASEMGSLRCSLLATALAIAASESSTTSRPPEDFMHKSVYLYSKSLLGLRNWIAAIQGKKFNDWESFGLTCFVCSCYEITVNHSYNNGRQHLDGVGAMLRNLGPDMLTSDLSRDLYFEYRALDITFQMIHPKATFICQRAWIYPSWKARHSKSSHPLQTLLDQTFLFPPIYAKFISLFKGIETSKPIDSSLVASLTQLLESARSIRSNIDGWYTVLQTLHELHKAQGKSLSNPQIFQTTFSQWSDMTADPSEVQFGRAFPICYIFADFSVATSFIFYQAIKICITGFIREMARNLSLLENQPASPLIVHDDHYYNEIMQHASHICQSAEYFLQPNKKIISALIFLFPLAVAKRAFTHISANDPQYGEAARKVSWCEMIEEKLKDFRLSPYNIE